MKLNGFTRKKVFKLVAKVDSWNLSHLIILLVLLSLMLDYTKKWNFMVILGEIYFRCRYTGIKSCDIAVKYSVKISSWIFLKIFFRIEINKIHKKTLVDWYVTSIRLKLLGCKLSLKSKIECWCCASNYTSLPKRVIMEISHSNNHEVNQKRNGEWFGENKNA